MMSRRPLAVALALLLCPSFALGSSASAGLMSPARMQSGITCLPVPGVGLRCTDGRVSSTVRASTVPCETSPGVWTHVPAGQACVSVRGLEAWGAVTTTTTSGDKIDAWGVNSGVTVTAISPGYRVSRASSGDMVFNLPGSTLAAPETRTTSCFLRAGTGATIYLGAGSGGAPTCPVTPGSDWARFSCTQTVPIGGKGGAVIGQSTPGPYGTVDTLACQNVAASTPGRPCWQASGAAPFTCAADVHTVSTSGFPTATGEVSITYRLAEACPAGQLCMVFDGRSGSVTAAPTISIGTTGLIQLGGIGSTLLLGAAPAPGATETFRFARQDGMLFAFRDGALVAAVPRSDMAWAPTAHLGLRYTADQGINGSFTSLRWKGTSSLKTVRAIGDSITGGVPGPTTSYPKRLQTLLGSNAAVINEGHSGWTTTQLRDLWTTTLRAQKVGTIVVLAGVNDINKGDTVDTAWTNLSAIYSEARTDGVRVIAVTLTPYKDSPGRWTTGRQAMLEDLNTRIRGAAGVTVVDAYVAMGSVPDSAKLRAEYDSGDGIHPNDAGAAALAALIAGAMQ